MYNELSPQAGQAAGGTLTIMDSNRGAIAQGVVKSCDLAQACIDLGKEAALPCVGDLAVPIEPPEATDLERLLGNVLFIVSE